MKRWLVVGILLLSIVGVLFLLVYDADPRANRRGGSASERALAAQGGNDGDPMDPAAAPDGDDGGMGRAARDDDPNRVAGPDVTIRGIVLRGDKPAANAQAVLYRAFPRRNGTTYRSETGSADRAATVIARAKCAEDGRFAITIARRSDLMVFADAPGAAFAWLKLLVPAQGDPKELEIQLGDGHALAGKVVDQDKQPVEGAAVSCALYDYWSPTLRVDAVTNEQGLFRFDGLKPGNYNVAVDSGRHPAQRRTVQIPATREVLFELVPGGSLAGRVSNDQGDAIAGADLVFQTGDTWLGKIGVATVTTDSTGSYRIPHVLAGPLRGVLLDHPDYGTKSSGRNEIVLPTELIEVGKEMRFDIKLPTGVTVRGIVVSATSDGREPPVVGADVRLMRMQSTYRSMTPVAVQRTGPDGRFEFRHVAEGTYGLEASTAFAMRRAQTTSNGRTPMTIDFFVDGAAPPPEQKLVMSPTGTVRGRIEGLSPDDLKSTSVSVAVGDVYRNTRVDSLGEFEITGVPPAPEATVTSYNPGLKSDPIEVRAGEVVEVTLSAETSGVWTGVVKDAEGNPIENAKVHAMLESQIKSQIRTVLQNRSNQRTTDADGRFAIPISETARKSQASLKWVIAAVHDEYELAMSAPVAMPGEGEGSDIEIQLERGGAISGSVVVEDGGSAANIRVSVYPRAVKGQPFENRPQRYSITDIDGTFEVQGIGPGEYTASAWSPGGQAESQSVKAGDSGVRIVIRPIESIAGVVLDEDGVPVRQGQVAALIPNGSKTRRQATQISNGRFRIWNLKPGAYQLEVTPTNRHGNHGGESFEKTVSGPHATGDENVVITVSWGNTIEGRVHAPGGKAAGGVAVLALPLKVAKRNRTPAPMAITNGRGEFLIKGLGDEEVELVAAGVGYQPATARARPGARDVTLQLQRGAVLKGRVLRPDGSPLANQWLSVQAAEDVLKKKIADTQSRAGNQYFAGFGNSALSGRTDGEGKFELTSLLDGTYTLYIRTEHGVAPADTRLQTGSAAAVIHLQPALTVSGIIVDEDGQPPNTNGGRRRLYVGARQGSQWFSSAQPGADGAFEIKGLPVGNITLQVWGNQNYGTTTMEVASGSQGVRIVLTRRKR